MIAQIERRDRFRYRVLRDKRKTKSLEQLASELDWRELQVLLIEALIFDECGDDLERAAEAWGVDVCDFRRLERQAALAVPTGDSKRARRS